MKKLLLILSILIAGLPAWAGYIPPTPTLGSLGAQADNKIQNVLTYGATGNGTTDDTVAIQACVNAAGTIQGATVYFPAGTYRITSPITITTQGLYVYGVGVMLGGSTIRQDTYGDPCFVDQGTSYVTFDGLYCLSTQTQTVISTTVDNRPGRDYAAGFYFSNASYCTVQNCSVNGMVTGVKLRGETSSNNSNDSGNRVLHCEMTGVSFGILAEQQTSPTVDDLTVTNITNSQPSAPPHAIYFTGPILALVYYTDLSIPATNQVTSTSRPFITSDIGGSLAISSGAGFTPGIYTVTAESGGTATLSASPGTVSSASGIGTFTTQSRNRSVVIQNVRVDGDLYASAVKVKWTTGLSVKGTVITDCERGLDLENDMFMTVSNVSFSLAEPLYNSDSQAAAINCQDCGYSTVTGCILNVSGVDNLPGVYVRCTNISQPTIPAACYYSGSITGGALTTGSSAVTVIPGTGYTVAPTITVVGGGGTGATATCNWSLDTQTFSTVTIVNPGSGYTSTPQIQVNGVAQSVDINIAGNTVISRYTSANGEAGYYDIAGQNDAFTNDVFDNTTGDPSQPAVLLRWASGLSLVPTNCTITNLIHKNTTIGVKIGNSGDAMKPVGTVVTQDTDVAASSVVTELAVTPAAIPSAPTGPAASNATAGNTVTWSASTGATSYNVYRSTTSGGEGATPYATLGNVVTYTDAALNNGVTYYYTVGAVNSAGVSSQSSEVSVLASVTTPATPTGVAATAQNGQDTISWTAVAGATSYAIYEGTSPSGEGGTPVSTPSGTATSQKITGLTNGTTYYFTMAAVNSAGTSAVSSEVSSAPTAIPIPIAPASVTATPGANSVLLAWSPSQNATSYNVYRGTTSGGETLLSSGVTATTYTDSTAANGTTYYYKVAAVSAGGTSSLTANGTVQDNGVGSLVTSLSSVQKPLTIVNSAAPLTIQNSAGVTQAQVNTSNDLFLYDPAQSGAYGELLWNQLLFTRAGNNYITAGVGSTLYLSASASTSNDTTIEKITSTGASFNASGNLSASGIPVKVLGSSSQSGDLLDLQNSSGTKFSGFTNGGDYNGYGLVVSALSTPTANAPTYSGTAGSTTYYYKVVAVSAGGKTLPSSEVSVGSCASTLSSSNKVTLTWSADPGAESYRVYRSTSSGAETLNSDGSGLTGLTYTDTGASSSGTPSTYADTGRVQAQTFLASGHVLSSAGVSGISVAAGAQASAASLVSGSNDFSGQVTVTFQSASAGSVAVVTFAAGFNNSPWVILTPANSVAAISTIYTSSSGTTFTISNAASTALTTSASWTYIVISH